ncbi:MAG: lytic transglycosylase domain-containing protein [Methylococcales bacterium]|nr:lytic transglycosylase domain-containing protein [Methylococcales bacterium]MDD5631211.1 lytic transglycosylase domain-containing protein [Methylococcales bacterium]
MGVDSIDSGACNLKSIEPAPNDSILLISFVFILMLTFCADIYAKSSHITININGEEYYSNENVFPGNRSVSIKVKKKSNVSSAPKNRHSYALGMNKRKYADLIARAADKHQVDAKLLHAVVQAESAYNATAISPAGAVGLMQLMPGTARRFGVSDRRDPYQNIDGGTRYLKHLLRLFDSDLKLAIAAYNAGENAVIQNNNAIPPYTETRHYVKEVLSLRNGLQPVPRLAYNTPRIQDNSNNWGNSGYTSDYTIEIDEP